MHTPYRPTMVKVHKVTLRPVAKLVILSAALIAAMHFWGTDDTPDPEGWTIFDVIQERNNAHRRHDTASHSARLRTAA